MANTIKTLTAGDITRKALAILHNNMVFCKNINRTYDDRFARTGAKNGGYLEIRNPNEFTVRTGAIMDTQDVTETTTQLVCATQLGIDINFSSAELTLSMDDFAERILTPAMTRLAAEVEKTVITACYKAVYNFENTTLGTAPVLSDVLAARAYLQRGLTPTGDRFLMVDAAAANSIITDSKSLYAPSDAIARQYEQGLLGTVSGFKMLESELTPRHTNGSRDDTTPIVANLANCANADDHLDTTSFDGTLTVGDVFYVPAVFKVNQETKVAYPQQQQWAVTVAETTNGTDAVAVTPLLYKSGPRQNVYHASWTGASGTIISVATGANANMPGGSGAASTTYVNNLAWHRDAFTMVTADLELPNGVDFAARKVIDGISMRIVRQYDVVNDKFPCRIDVLFGQKTIRPEWAVRVCG